MERLLSGIQPSGELHVGNYLGAIRNWVAMQDTYEAFFFVANLHSMTVDYEAPDMTRRILDMAKTLLACGVNPRKSCLFVQSDIVEHAMLAWILNCVTPLGELYRMTQFKDKSAQYEQNINAGLLTYPVLQAADILIYKAAVVPVGEDQVQHLELCREIARKYNARFGMLFPEPRPLLTRARRILGLDGKAKMSKSLGNHIPLLAEPERVWELLRPAVTDPARVRRNDPGHPEVCNLYSLHQGFSPEGDVAEIERDCRSAAIGCVDCKKRLSANMSAELAPVREQYRSLSDDDVRGVLAAGAQQARSIAQATLNEVKQATGIAL